jgi:hypothetical protein
LSDVADFELRVYNRRSGLQLRHSLERRKACRLKRDFITPQRENRNRPSPASICYRFTGNVPVEVYNLYFYTGDSSVVGVPNNPGEISVVRILGQNAR